MGSRKWVHLIHLNGIRRDWTRSMAVTMSVAVTVGMTMAMTVTMPMAVIVTETMPVALNRSARRMQRMVPTVRG